MCLLKRRICTAWHSVNHIPIYYYHSLGNNSLPLQIREPIWQLGCSHQLQLETDQTGCLWRQNTLELNSTFAKEFLSEHETRWRKITPRKLDKAKVFEVWLFISTTPGLCYFLQFVLAPLIKEPPTVHQVNPENKSFGKQQTNRKKAGGGWFNQTRRIRKIFPDFTGMEGLRMHWGHLFYINWRRKWEYRAK